MTVGVLWRFLTVTGISLQCVIVVFPGHSRLLFSPNRFYINAQVLLNLLNDLRKTIACDGFNDLNNTAAQILE